MLPGGPFTRYAVQAQNFWESRNESLTYIKASVVPGALAPPQVGRTAVGEADATAHDSR
jgi:hypothetical protein